MFYLSVPMSTEPNVNVPRPGESRDKRLTRIEGDLIKRYDEQRRRIHPTYATSKTDRNKSTWEKVAEMVVSKGLNPFEFIDAQFDLWPEGSFPYPNQLLGDVALERQQQYSTTMTGSPDSRVHAQRFYVSNMTGRIGMTEGAAFACPHIDLRAWFRVLFCPETAPEYPEILQKYRAVAIRQIERDSRLKQFLLHNYGNRAQRIIQPTVPNLPNRPSSPLPQPSPTRSQWGSWI